MKNILTLSFLFISLGSFAQKVKLALNLKQDSTYYFATNADLNITETINGNDMVIKMLMGFTIANKVIAIKDSVYEMEVQYEGLNMHMDAGGKKLEFDSNDKDTTNVVSKIISSMLNKPFFMSISKSGRVLEIKNSDTIYAHMFDKLPQITDAQKVQFKSQMEQSFGDKAIKNNFQDGFPVFPGKKVGPNDTWVAITGIESTITAQIKTTYTLQAITAEAILINGQSVISQSADTGYKILNGFPMRFTNVNGSSTDQIKLDRKTGWILEAKMTRTIKGTVEIQSSSKIPGGYTFPMAITANTTVTSK